MLGTCLPNVVCLQPCTRTCICFAFSTPDSRMWLTVMNVLLSCSASFAVTCSGASSAKLKSYFSIPLLLPKFALFAPNFLLCDFSVFSLLTSWHLTRCRVRKARDSFKFYCAILKGMQHKNAKLQQLGTPKLPPRKRSPYLRFSILKIREKIKRKSGTKFENKKPAAKKKDTQTQPWQVYWSSLPFQNPAKTGSECRLSAGVVLHMRYIIGHSHAKSWNMKFNHRSCAGFNNTAQNGAVSMKLRTRKLRFAVSVDHDREGPQQQQQQQQQQPRRFVLQTCAILEHDRELFRPRPTTLGELSEFGGNCGMQSLSLSL